jgi:hypothetical protein
LSSRQRLAVLAPPVVVGVMYPIFQMLARALAGNWRIAWYLGLVTYWLIWGAAFPLWIIGVDNRGSHCWRSHHDRVERMVGVRRTTASVRLLC